MTNRPTQSGPSAVCRALAAVAILTLNLTVAFARDDAAKKTTYRCTTKDAVDIQQDGSLNRLTAQEAIKYFDKIAINVADGHISYPTTGILEDWVVEKTTGVYTDYVLFPTSPHKIRADAVTHFIRLRTSDAQPRFVVVTLTFLVSGTCALAPD